MKISVSRGLTINRGNYESERIDVGIEVPISEANSTAVAAQIAQLVEDMDDAIEAATGRRP